MLRTLTAIVWAKVSVAIGVKAKSIVIECFKP